MTIGILFLSWVLVFCAGGNLAEASDGGLLSAGGHHTCAIDDEGVKCWGYYGQTDVPRLENPTSVSAGDYHTCAVDEEGVKCWGSDSGSQTDVPELENPTSVSAGDYHTCAIDDEGVKCWGYNGYGQTNVPRLENPTSVSVEGHHTCAIDDEGVKCWGSDSGGQTDVPELKNPTSVSAGASHTCAIDEEGVKCWGSDSGGQTDVPELKNPTSVSAGASHTCAVDEQGIKCWGSDSGGQTDVPELKNPTSVSAGKYHTCAIDDEGVKCWGSNGHFQTNVPPLKIQPVPLLALTELGNLLGGLANRSTPVRTAFFNFLRSFVKDNLNSSESSYAWDQFLHGRYALIAFLKTSIEAGDSIEYIKNIIPSYVSRMKMINKQTGIHSLDNVKDFPLTRLTALKFMQASLATMTEFLSAEDKVRIQHIIRLIGLAMTETSNKQNIMRILAAIDTDEAIVHKLNHSSKTQFLVLTLKTAQQWLTAKIK